MCQIELTNNCSSPYVTGPYPGYVHGNPERGICPNGCKAELNSVITEDESTTATMMREAMEYLELYYHERNEDMCGKEGFLPKRERMARVMKAINETGTYEHTFDELGEAVFFIYDMRFVHNNMFSDYIY